MKKFFTVLAACFVAGVLMAVGPNSLDAVTYLPSSAAPSGTCTNTTLGANLLGAQGWYVVIAADAGLNPPFLSDGGSYGSETFAGGGTVQCYFCARERAGLGGVSGAQGLVRSWVRCNSVFDYTPIDAGTRVQASPNYTVSVGDGTIYYWPYTVGVTQGDGGTRDAGFAITIVTQGQVK